jgi:hypothetical protein
MLIGGPNQSHKVNFKEPLPARGKISKKTFAFCFVNTFPEIFEESFVKERYLFSAASLSTPASGGRCLAKGLANMGIAFS